MSVSVGIEFVVARAAGGEYGRQAADVALGSAQGDVVVIGESVDVESFAVIEAGEHIGETVAECFLRLGSRGHDFRLFPFYLQCRYFIFVLRQVLSRSFVFWKLFCSYLF